MLTCMETLKTDRVPQLADKFVLRMPDGMREKIMALAKANNRSMNAEILLMLQQAMDARTSGMPAIDLDLLAETLASKLATKLQITDNS